MNATANTASDTVIRVENLTVSKADLTICCLSGMAVVSGERLGIVGPNGSGKTTLLRVLAGLETEYTGQCRIAVDQRERIFLHQSPYLFRGTVLHNVAYGLVARSMPRAKRLDIVRECLERLGMSEFEDRDVSSLSGGERRRVALARACILRPQLLLLDEPLAELDSGGVESVQRSLAELSQSTILIASPTPLPSEFAERTVKFSKESK